MTIIDIIYYYNSKRTAVAKIKCSKIIYFNKIFMTIGDIRIIKHTKYKRREDSSCKNYIILESYYYIGIILGWRIYQLQMLHHSGIILDGRKILTTKFKETRTIQYSKSGQNNFTS